jgi:membrane-associated protease RseP (regulator of RpoE activity)
MSDETAESDAADTAPSETVAGSGSETPAAKRTTFEVPKWAALVVAGVLLLGVGFAIGWVAAPGGGGHERGEVPAGQRFPGPGRQQLPQFPGPQTGSPRRVLLGIVTQDATGTTGAQIARVATGGPADQAGLKAGDVITAVDGTPVTSSAQLAQRIGAHQPGDQVTITYTRGGASAQVQVKLSALNVNPAAPTPAPSNSPSA